MLRISYHLIIKFILLLPLVFLPKRSIFVGIFCLHHKGESIASQL